MISVKDLVELFRDDPELACVLLLLDRPMTRLRFVLKLCKITSREFAKMIESDEHYVSRCFTTGNGFTRSWDKISTCLDVPKKWFLTGKIKPIMHDEPMDEKVITKYCVEILDNITKLKVAMEESMMELRSKK